MMKCSIIDESNLEFKIDIGYPTSYTWVEKRYVHIIRDLLGVNRALDNLREGK